MRRARCSGSSSSIHTPPPRHDRARAGPGVSIGTVLRMIGNVRLDGLIGATPVAGVVGDAFFRANRRHNEMQGYV
ncbi:DUF4112 domain-containing protein [Roseicella sp. DB1501]|uniref:DUF4112 domain-containing protein n=1 Tax=Roseicella sp. DB1501 TaxID=2730925 RepID=UPI00266F7E53|nr:DUF4112 domain-containing protein [Roseicella sp. DB1501]